MKKEKVTTMATFMEEEQSLKLLHLTMFPYDKKTHSTFTDVNQSEGEIDQ